MGELATAVEDLPRYVKDNYTLVTSQFTHKLDALIREVEAQSVSFKGWATPGACLNSAALDGARTVCRRAERRVCVLQEADQLQNSEIIIYLNRLADLLWLSPWRAGWRRNQRPPCKPVKEGACKWVARRYVGCWTRPFQLPLGMIRRFTGKTADLL